MIGTTQKLNIDLEIMIPSDSVLIKRADLQNLKDQSLIGVYWSMKDLESHIGKKQHWIKEHILYVPRFKKHLDSINGGFVYYPEVQGQTWAFHAKKMAEFLDTNFNEIYK